MAGQNAVRRLGDDATVAQRSIWLHGLAEAYGVRKRAVVAGAVMAALVAAIHDLL